MDNTKYIQFIKVGDLNMWKLDLKDTQTNQFYELLMPFFAKKNLEFRTDLPSIDRDQVGIFLYHKDWKWMQGVFRLTITPINEYIFKVEDIELKDKAYKKAKHEFKVAYPQSAFNDVLLATLKSDLKEIRFKI